MKKLDFEGSPEGQKKFAMIYQAWVIGFPGARGPDALERAVQLQSKLKKVSHETGRKYHREEGPDERVLNEGGGSVSIDDAELKMLLDSFDNVPWTVSALDDAKAIREWLTSKETGKKRR